MLEMHDNGELDDAVAAVVAAILVQGPRPWRHAAMMANHRNEWPALWDTLDHLVARYREAVNADDYYAGWSVDPG